MKIKSILLAVALMAGATAQAQSLGDLLKGLGGGSEQSGTASTIGNILSGIFAKSDLTVEDLAGQYESDGPAITFKSDNFLQQAGGMAGAAALETKLQPYYEKYGLNGMKLVIDKEGNFTLTVKNIPLSGTVVAKDDKGEFTFNIMALKTMKIGQFTSYVQKSGNNLDLMFDAKKLKELISTIGKLSGIQIAKTMGTLLDSYDGANIGFKMVYTGAAPASENEQQAAPEENEVGAGVGTLLDILGKSRKK